MSKKLGFNIPNRLTAAVFVVFGLLTVAVVASEARNQSPHVEAVEVSSTSGIIQESLLVSRVGTLVRSVGNRLVSW